MRVFALNNVHFECRVHNYGMVFPATRGLIFYVVHFTVAVPGRIALM